MKAYVGVEVWLFIFLTSVLGVGEWSDFILRLLHAWGGSRRYAESRGPAELQPEKLSFIPANGLVAIVTDTSRLSFVTHVLNKKNTTEHNCIFVH